MKFIELLEEYKIAYRQGGEHHHVSQGWLGFDCPFCGKGSGHFHMGYNLAKRFTICWRCGYHPLFLVLLELTNEPSGVCRTLVKSLGREQTEITRPRGQLLLPQGLGPLQPVHKRYLRQRRLDPLEMERVWGLQGIGLAARLSWRLWLPITQKRKLISWTTRALSDQQVRYLNAKPEEEEIPAKTVLYGADLVRHTIVVCEGPLDALTLGPGAVATMGVNYSRAQLLQMARYPRRYICFDNEPLAQQRARRLCQDLSIYQGDTWNLALDAKDANSASPREIQLVRKLLR